MKRQKGFTLLEILIVVVIAVSVAAFALPAYKKMQDRTNFMAAQGLLVEIGNGLKMLQEELSFNYPSGATVVNYSWQNSAESWNEDKNTVSSHNAHLLLFKRRYVGALPLTTSNYYKNYMFVLCPENTASSSYCCGGNSSVVACMYDPSYSSRPTRGEYYGAVYYQDGSVERVAKRS